MLWSPRAEIVRSYNLDFHLDADDTQFYICYFPSSQWKSKMQGRGSSVIWRRYASG